jgi:hypothetical protein
MNQLTAKFDGATGEGNATQLLAPRSLMDSLARVLIRFGILTKDLDYHLIRASMVIIFLFFGYQKWFQYEAEVLIPYISNGPLIFWLYPAFGIRGATWFLGVSEWTFGTLLFLGFWNKKFGNSRGSRLMRYIHLHRHDYSIHAKWLGRICRRFPGDDRTCRLSNERYRSVFRIILFVEARFSKSITRY